MQVPCEGEQHPKVPAFENILFVGFELLNSLCWWCQWKNSVTSLLVNTEYGVNPKSPSVVISIPASLIPSLSVFCSIGYDLTSLVTRTYYWL
jgi:hypothetical protein